MGDNIETGVWEGDDDDAILLPNIVDDDDDDNVDNDSDEECHKTVNVDEKKSKKKEKLKDLKRRTQNAKETGARDIKKLEGELPSWATQAEILNDFLPGKHFFPDDFFNPHQGTSQPCNFVRAMASGLPSYKKALAVDSVTQEGSAGSPVIIVVCSSARRSADIINQMSKLLHCKIAKLFAKHFKIQDQVEILSKQNFPVAVGTPNRLLKLCEYGALRLNRLTLFLIDMKADGKNFTILSLSDVQADLRTLLETFIVPERSHLKIALVPP